MTALIVMETLSILLLGVLVAGLLRSHAEILRQLHELGAGYDGEIGPDAHRHGPDAQVSPGPATVRTSVVEAVTGESPAGDAVTVGLGRLGERTLLLFLSSGCERCEQYWEALRAGSHLALGPSTRTVAVARDRAEESCSRLASLGPSDVPVIMSSAAWDDFAIPGSPYAVLVGEDTAVLGEGTAPSWTRLLSLLSQALGDREMAGGPHVENVNHNRGRLDHRGSREARADRELHDAGITPGHPSLYPPTVGPPQ